MDRIWIIARHEYLTNVRRTGFIIFTALVPVLGMIGLLVASVFGGQVTGYLQSEFDSSPGAVGIVDRHGAFTPILPQHRDRFRSYSDEAIGQAALRSGEAEMLLVIPEDYMETGKVRVWSTESDFRTGAMINSGRMRTFLVTHLLRGEVDVRLQRRVAHPMSVEQVTLLEGDAAHRSSSGAAGLVANTMVGYFLGTLLVATVFTASGYLLRGVSDEKTNRVIEIIVSSVSADELLAGKVLGLGALGLTQVVIWLLSGFALSGGAQSLLGYALPLQGRVDLFILSVVYYILGFLGYAVLMGAAGALGTSLQESFQLARLVSLMAALPLFLGGFIMQNPNMTLARIFSWLPLSGPSVMLLRLPIGQIPLVDIAGSIVVSVATVPVLLWAGARVFRMGLLMYGKRPSWSQVLRALREA